MKVLDMQATAAYGIPGIVLMEHAAKAVADNVAHMLRDCRGKKVTVVCGKGNNGGDGFGAARWLLTYGCRVKVLLVGAKQEDVQGDAALELALYRKNGGVLTYVQNEKDLDVAEVTCLNADLIVDAMLGTGFDGELRGLYKEMCRIINNAGHWILAVDVPTGVNADTGAVDKDAIVADETITMALIKQGLLLHPAAQHVGTLNVAFIGMPDALLKECDSKKYRLTGEMVSSLMPIRQPDAHKGDAGRIIVVAGSPGFLGAAAMASHAAVKAGAGLVSLLTPLSSRDLLAVKLNEEMVHGLIERAPGVLGGGAASDILRRLEGADVLAIGPGLGTADNTGEVIREVLLKATKPVIIDADALTALKDHLDVLTRMQAPKVLTPHLGEMARLTGLTVEDINADRINIAKKYAVAWKAVVVLKGAPTVIGCPDGSVYVNTTGCNAMATGGSGDVLTGIIAALAGQEISLQEAALCGVFLHGLAGECAADGSIGLAAGEIAQALPQARRLLDSYVDYESLVCNKGIKVIE